MSRRLAAIAVAVVTSLATVAITELPAAALPTINGGGSSFAKLEIDQWRAEVARAPYNLRINYVAQGSSFGRQQYIAGNLEFAASDIPFQPAETTALQKTSRKDFVYVPVSAGGLGFMYNLTDLNGQRVTNLRLTRSAVCRIFTTPNLKWNDPEIQAANPQLRLPPDPIRPIVRADGSGTSYVFSDFCLTVAPAIWQDFVRRMSGDTSLDPEFLSGRPTSNWPTSWGAGTGLAADGVAAAVADPVQGKGAITYNEAGFAKVRGFPNAYLQNAAGQYLLPDEENVTVALGYATGRPDGTFVLNYTAGDPKAYFPSTYSYVIAQTTGFPADKGETLARFLCYSVTKGQRPELTSKLGYARLSSVLVGIARTSISKIPGAPAWEQCAVSDAPPPPAPASTQAPAAGGGGGGATGGGSTGGGSAGGGATAGGTGGDAGVTGDPTATTLDPTATTLDPAAPATTLDPTIVGVLGADGVCVDAVSGDEIDAAYCTSSGGATGDAASGGGVVPAAAINPTVAAAEDSGPETTQVLWVLLQGAAVAALGVGLAGARRRSAK